MTIMAMRQVEDLTGRKSHGLTLVELMATLVVAGIILAIAVPSFSQMLERKRLQAATETLVSDLRLARSESTKRNTDVRVSFTTGASWCYGLRDAAVTCDCTATDCTMGGAVKTQPGNEFADVQLTQAAFGAGTVTTWDNLRNTANAGRVCLRTNTANYRTRIIVSGLGRIRVCSPSAGYILNYPICPTINPCP